MLKINLLRLLFEYKENLLIENNCTIEDAHLHISARKKLIITNIGSPFFNRPTRVSSRNKVEC